MKGPAWLVEKAFDLNDWFVLGCLVLAYTVMCFMPKRFPMSTTLLLILFSAAVASILDNSAGGHVFDLYDIMDGPAYTLMDFIVYFLYAPFAYYFIYFYDRWQIKRFGTVGYIILFSAISVAFELLCAKAGVFHYKNGYRVQYSFCIYLFVQSATIWFYQYISKRAS
ncbi:hypothetical protein [Paenibacillus thermotolerans]|uniref:hypothetical protein n=1 Tax=Paenibacillus thermotolerans TaxID=3027807 RepID=UPI00236774A8|nr:MULTISPECIES: hypothetical protein [unclassified Paenibacillus]